jgi:protein gp37
VINIKKQCEENGIPFFFKQWGTWGSDMVKRNKKKNGRIFQGKIWNDYPQCSPIFS